MRDLILQLSKSSIYSTKSRTECEYYIPLLVKFDGVDGDENVANYN